MVRNFTLPPLLATSFWMSLLGQPLSARGESTASTPGFVNDDTIGTYACYASAGLYGQASYSPSSCLDEALAPVYPFNQLRLRAPDDSIRATFVPQGAGLTELWVKDKHGEWQDVVLSFDNTTNYATDKVHPNFGPIVGRYANRIKNGTFEIGGKTYHTPLNENNLDTLHGGDVGYDRSAFVLSHLNASSVTFTHHDPAGNQGFPHSVNSSVSYHLRDDATWDVRISATSSGPTPVMLSSHDYWNLNPQSLVDSDEHTRSILEHTLHIPRASHYVKTDSILVPTGELPSVKGTALDFTSAVPFSQNFGDTEGICGAGCQGWDSCLIMPEGPPEGGAEADEAALTLHSPASGIKMQLFTDQTAWQVYTSSGLAVPSKGLLPRKRAHGGILENAKGAGERGTDPPAPQPKKFYENYSAVVIEAQDYIDGINHPEWGRKAKQVLKEGEEYKWHTVYKFSVE